MQSPPFCGLLLIVVSRLGTAGDDDGELKHSHTVNLNQKFCCHVWGWGFPVQADEKVEYRVFKKHMYGGPKGLGDPNYRHWFVQPFFLWLFPLAERCPKWRKILWYHRSKNATYCSPHYTISCACLFIYLPLQRMRDITRTQLCTKEVSGHNLYPFEDAESVSLVAFLLKISKFLLN